MNPRLTYEDAEGEIFSIAVDYNLKGYSLHKFRKLILTPEAAKELAGELIRFASWSEHPLYRWAVKKTSQP